MGEEYGEITSGVSDETVSAYDAMSIATNNFFENAEALIQSYNEAYQAAYESLSGQYALWDDAAEIAAMDAEDINDSLSSQANYWNTYNSNLETLLNKSDKIDGLREMIATFADGSRESVDAIAGLADASVSESELKKIVENWRQVQEAEKKASGSLAEIKTDFDNQLNELVYGTENSVSAMVNKMNLSDEARTAADETIKAYADGLRSGMGSVEEAAAIVKNAGTNALSFTKRSDNSSSSSAANTMGNAAGGSANNESTSGLLYGPRLGRITVPKIEDYVDGYAVGTYNAAGGLALVGERGPELVNFNGGEQVLTAEKTNAILSRSSSGGGGHTITVAPVFQISGNADEDTLRRCAEQIVEMVRDILREDEIDVQRGIYA